MCAYREEPVCWSPSVTPSLVIARPSSGLGFQGDSGEHPGLVSPVLLEAALHHRVSEGARSACRVAKLLGERLVGLEEVCGAFDPGSVADVDHTAFVQPLAHH